MTPRRAAKIIATLGPASSTPDRIRALHAAGADLFRLNFSHGERAEHRARYEAVRRLEREIGRPIGILVDLQGPKIRVGKFAGGKVTLGEGKPLRLDLDPAPGDAARAPLPHPEVFQVLSPGQMVLLDDGRLRLRVESVSADRAETVVVTGGVLGERKGVNLPGAILPLSALTEKDLRDLDFALSLGADWIALSFVQRPDDVAELRKIVGNRAAIMSKIEKPQALARLDQIVDLSDAVMVARGDLGVELPPEDVPTLQKRIVRTGRRAGKPVVVATQMLDSMVRDPAPTRAEASDVANAVYDGADAVMLSAETASGAYPAEAVAMMARIIGRVEHDPAYRVIMDANHPPPQATAADAITLAAREVATTIAAACIVTYTSSGSTALRASRERPAVPILCLTGRTQTARRMTLAWGVHCFFSHDVSTIDEMVAYAQESAKSNGIAKSGERIVITAGMPFGTPGATNMLRVAWVE
ncbi:MAG: pyruvate kinase [Alphaproteobacteria bacterium]|nr:pyruvate kinase [Candidatus Odyssella sp.]